MEFVQLDVTHNIGLDLLLARTGAVGFLLFIAALVISSSCPANLVPEPGGVTAALALGATAAVLGPSARAWRIFILSEIPHCVGPWPVLGYIPAERGHRGRAGSAEATQPKEELLELRPAPVPA